MCTRAREGCRKKSRILFWTSYLQGAYHTYSSAASSRELKLQGNLRVGEKYLEVISMCTVFRAMHCPAAGETEWSDKAWHGPWIREPR